MSDKFVGPVESTFQDGHREISNNNRFTQISLDGDSNANDIQSQAGKTLQEFISHTEEQDKVIIWGTDSQCDDPELAEFEMLECQELEAYLVEAEENYAVPGRVSNNVSQTSKVEALEEINKNEESRPNVTDQVSHKPMSRTAETCALTELSSDNEVFVSCYSTMSSFGGSLASALDNTDRTRPTESWPVQTESYRTLSDFTLPSQSCVTISDRSRNSLYADGTHVDLSLNTTTLSEEPLSEAQEHQPAQSAISCKEPSGLLRNDLNECNPSTADAEMKHNEIRNTSEDNVGYHGNATVECQDIIREEFKHPEAKAGSDPKKTLQPFGSEVTESSLTNSEFPHDSSHELKCKSSQSDETLDKSLMPGSSGLLSQCVLAEPKRSQKQASFERPRSVSPTSLDRRKPWCSPSRSATPPSHKPIGSPRKHLPTSPAKTVNRRAPAQESTSTRGLKPPSKSYLSSGIPKPIPPQHPFNTESEAKKSPPAQKPKNVRPKIITSVRKNPQVKPLSAEGPYETSTLPSRLTAYPSTPAAKERRAGGPKGSPVLSSSSVLYEKHQHELQKAGYYSPPGLAVSGVRRPSHTIPQKLFGKSESFHGEFPDRRLIEGGRAVLLSTPEGAGVCRPPRALTPQLGLSTRQPATKSRTLMSGQRSVSPLSHIAPARQVAYCYPDPAAGEQKKCVLEMSARSLLPKPGQSGLQPPAFSHLSPARLAAFGFVRSASVSSVSSNQSSDSSPSSHNRPASPYARKELQKDEVTVPTVTSSKRCAVVSPKPQSPVRQRSCVARAGVRVEDSERERVEVQRLRERCEVQALQLAALQAKLHTATLGMDVLAITTQHFCMQSENGALKERELSLELCRVRDEVAVAVGRWESLQGEKVELECRFQVELQELRVQQQKELEALQDRLRQEQQDKTVLLQKQQSTQLEQLRSQHHQQVEEMTESHEAALQETEGAHSATLATLQEEHTRTIKNLKMAHEQEKKSLEEEFEKLRLSLQDQVDTLTFQNHSLKDRAKRFEEALRRSTDEQIVDALAPYQHIEEDLKSLKEVLEMKNQQIHDQQLKISELEKMAQKNVLLEERVQVLQQQNEDLKARIDMNVAMSRQLTEANANLQEYVEKESNEKKRLSRTNEELLWRLQTGELSPRMSPNQSPMHRPHMDPASPTHLSSCPP